MMKVLDYVVLIAALIAFIILFFLRQCTLDIWALLLGIIVAALSAGSMWKQYRDAKKKEEAEGQR